MQKIGSPLRMGGGAENQPLVVLQGFQPVADIGGVILADLRGDLEICAKESGAELSESSSLA